MWMRLAILQFLIVPVITLDNLCHADTEVEFPAQAVGNLYGAPREQVRFGADAHLERQNLEWKFLAPAAGKVQLPDGMLVRLSISAALGQSSFVDDANWISRVPSQAIHSLVIQAPIDDRQFARFTHWKGLQELVLRECNVTSAIATDLAKLTELKSLSLSRLPSIDDGLMATVAALSDLQEFSLRRTKLTDAGMSLLSRSRSLSSVLVDGVAITDEGIASLVKLPKLVALNVYAEESDEGESSPSPSVQTKVTDAGLEHIGTCSQLESLNIHGAKVSLTGLQRLFARCPKLRYLAISRRAVDLGALGAASSLAHLETIRITGTVLNDQDARQLSQLKNLRQIEGILQLSNEGVEQLAALSYLESLHFSGDANDECTQFLSGLRNLQELSIQGTQITDEGLTRLRGLSRLKSVRLNGHGFTTGCLQTVASWPNLDSLWLWHFGQRKDAQSEWSELTTLPAKLRSLDIAFCPTMGDEQLMVISASKTCSRYPYKVRD